MSDLKAGPFCGRIPDIEDCGEHRWFVRCKCGAVRAWNKRKELRVKDTNVPSTDTISRQAAIDALMEDQPEVWTDSDYELGMKNQHRSDVAIIEALPSAEPRKGKWIYGENDCQDGWFCSECRFFIPWDYDYYGLNNINFIKDFHVCPHCKAEMVTYTGKKEDTDES